MRCQYFGMRCSQGLLVAKPFNPHYTSKRKMKPKCTPNPTASAAIIFSSLVKENLKCPITESLAVTERERVFPCPGNSALSWEVSHFMGCPYFWELLVLLTNWLIIVDCRIECTVESTHTLRIKDRPHRSHIAALLPPPNAPAHKGWGKGWDFFLNHYQLPSLTDIPLKDALCRGPMGIQPRAAPNTHHHPAACTGVTGHSLSHKFILNEKITVYFALTLCSSFLKQVLKSFQWIISMFTQPNFRQFPFQYQYHPQTYFSLYLWNGLFCTAP